MSYSPQNQDQPAQKTPSSNLGNADPKNAETSKVGSKNEPTAKDSMKDKEGSCSSSDNKPKQGGCS